MAVNVTPPAQAKDERPEHSFRSLSGTPVRALYTEEDLPAGIGGPQDPIGRPGSSPGVRAPSLK